MAAYDIQFVDPGGEYYFSVGPSAAGIWTTSNSGSCNNNAPAGRATLYALSNGNNGRNYGNFASWCVGAAIYCTVLTAGILFNFQDSGNAQCDVRLTPAGALTVTRNGTVLGSTATALIAPLKWNYIEVKLIVASGTSGSAEIRINGVVALTLTGINTQNTVNATANQLIFQSLGGSTTHWKDMYVMTDTGVGPYTTYLGDITVGVYYPNAAGTNQAWTLGAGSSQTVAVQDGINHTGTWPDGDTSYILSATTGQISDFAHQNVAGGTVFGVMHATYARKDDAGTRQIAQVCLSGVSQEQGATISLTGTYAYYFDVVEKDPNTSAQWTVANLNSATFGVKEIT